MELICNYTNQRAYAVFSSGRGLSKGSNGKLEKAD